MPCMLCHKPEKSAREDRDYLCGVCTMQLFNMNKDQKRAFLDHLLSKKRMDEAEFVSIVFSGRISQPKAHSKIIPRKGQKKI